ncbi:beta-ketoacyl synthase-like protein [Sphaerotilus hippei]|uniref:Beta-ketoacyl synthase-like protein n=1 Tax=Sphaerotilus hippei TaxID=744406 RepID=A0A318H1B0_9BURK|nr:beta-ketoacyl synthase chain length factor [Sphaerotilus hippei]PXW96638.1 beta-ketoacyl synthase-like protein [Sphaerotilus hippei]
MTGITLYLQGVGLLGPGLEGWAEAAPVLRGEQAARPAATVVPPPQRLPPAERRRAGAAIRIAMAVADAACADAGIDPALLATVFTSSSGDGANCHALCEALAGADRLLSPTRFTNSVHNAAAGYWHIAVGSRAASTSVCGFDASFGAGLVEAVMQVGAQQQQLLLVASDTPYPEPLHATRPLPDALGVALVLTPQPGPATQARLGIELQPAGSTGPVTPCADAALERLRQALPAAQALPLLAALARARAGSPGPHTVVIGCRPDLRLVLTLETGAAA